MNLSNLFGFPGKATCMFTLLTLLLAGCQQKGSSTVNDETPLIPVTIENKSFGYDTSLFVRNEIIFLETNESSMISDMDKLIVVGRTLFILDKTLDQIFQFDRNGKFLNKLNAVGSGPGEYSAICDFSIDEDRQEIIVNTSSPEKIMRYDLKGNYIGELDPTPYFYETTYYQGHLIGLQVPHTKGDSYLLSFSQWGNDPFSQKTIPSEMTHIVDFTTFSEGTQLNRSLHLNVTQRFDNTVYRWEEGQMVPSYQFDFGQKNTSIEEQGSLKEQEFIVNLFKTDKIFSIVDVVESPKSLLFHTNISGNILLAKESLHASFYQKIRDTSTHTELLNNYISTQSFGDTTFVAYPMEIPQIKSYTQKRDADCPEWFIKKVEQAQEDDNPILYLYTLR